MGRTERELKDEFLKKLEARKERTKPLSVRVREDLLHEFQSKCREKNANVADVVNVLIELYSRGWFDD